MYVCLTKVGADVETREGTDVETGEGADVETGEGADAWVVVTGRWSSSPKVTRFLEATLWADDDLQATARSCAGAFAAGFFLAPGVDLQAIRDSIEESEHESK